MIMLIFVSYCGWTIRGVQIRTEIMMASSSGISSIAQGASVEASDQIGENVIKPGSTYWYTALDQLADLVNIYR